MTLNPDGVVQLRDLALAAVAANTKIDEFGEIDAAVLAEICAGWLRDSEDRISCCCGECG